MSTDRTLKFPVLFRCFPLLFLGMIAACNAIEPERVSPQAKVKMPEIQTDPTYVDYLVEPYRPEGWNFEKHGSYPVVHMRIPKASYYNSDAFSGPYRVYNNFIVMFYPDFSGLVDPENAECENVDGTCLRQMMMGFGEGPAGYWDEIQAREIMKNELDKGYIKSIDALSPYPGLELIGVVGSGWSGGYSEAIYVSRDTKGQPEFVVRCDKEEP